MAALAHNYLNTMQL